ncbi:hypothetical protein BGW36DRAFT_354245 [Talaromyces proteolyticus]|uniref:Uncharacterized protein n=1 Tax=Talaromyces proteolyticus TaxID=1131652 RepID=A0AAD4Q6P3_9EURO|nr:uncharacterized protein BGW36DRAFT_354245 [Talaromyces proteolyticus]KAH8705853.1 hypothetical protein BGW36DRAFT_354245 [Talaromyces proteolyticus]
MSSNIPRPLAIFYTQTQSQKYIKPVLNLEDAWRSIVEKLGDEQDTTFIRTTFDVDINIQDSASEGTSLLLLKQNHSRQHYKIEIPISQHLPPHSLLIIFEFLLITGLIFFGSTPRIQTIHKTIRMSKQKKHFSLFQTEVFENYDTWVDTYTSNFQSDARTPEITPLTFSSMQQKTLHGISLDTFWLGLPRSLLTLAVLTIWQKMEHIC